MIKNALKNFTEIGLFFKSLAGWQWAIGLAIGLLPLVSTFISGLYTNIGITPLITYSSLSLAAGIILVYGAIRIIGELPNREEETMISIIKKSKTCGWLIVDENGQSQMQYLAVKLREQASRGNFKFFGRLNDGRMLEQVQNLLLAEIPKEHWTNFEISPQSFFILPLIGYPSDLAKNNFSIHSTDNRTNTIGCYYDLRVTGVTKKWLRATLKKSKRE